MSHLQYLKNHEIDRQKWDECIENSPQGVIYALSWYLDFCESEWHAVVEMEGGQYVTVMPIQLKTKYMFTFIHQNPYSFVLGVFSTNKKFSRQDFLHFINQAFSKFHYIAKYRFNAANSCLFLETEIQRRLIVHHLSINSPYEIVRKKYSIDREKNLKKSKRYFQTIELSNDYESFIQMFNQNTLPRMNYQQYRPEINLLMLEKAALLGYAELYFVQDKHGKNVAGSVFFKFKNKLHNIYSSATEIGRKNSSMTFLIDHIIQKYANSTLTILDFGGSYHKGITHFKEGFGAKPLLLNEVQISKFPKVINNLNMWRRKIIKKYLLKLE